MAYAAFSLNDLLLFWLEFLYSKITQAVAMFILSSKFACRPGTVP
jgi:hypothetical protein